MINFSIVFYTITISIFLKLLRNREDILEIDSTEDKYSVAERLMSFGLHYTVLGLFEPWMNIWVSLILAIPLILISLAFVVYILEIIENSIE